MKASNSLERVLAVLEVFSEQRLEWTPEELMQELGYSRPTLYRYLKTLRDAGLLMSTGNAAFTLGPRVVEMDYLVRKSDPLVVHGAPHLKTLIAERPCTALLVRWYGNKILCVASDASAAHPASSYPRGRPMPLGRGAIARSIIAFLPRARLMALIERNLADFRAVGLGTSAEEIHASLRKVRKAGFAVAFGEVTPGAVGIAAPIFDAAGHPVASLCMTIAGHLVSGADIDRIGPHLHDVALQIGQESFPV
ncbi:IclR family transcriptional regulator [Bradyrhizobium sp. U87765 SZCCT0131]|uniref:IclR family transcriptional regulator n=1 Tax=unclassified Bradyrhizobium TaxID=2631580 RepID=UPI001BAC7A7A|nr:MULTISPECIES: IclR family transcriptional regulator [unclassified Bradyrhizobium]MBR1222572.1 IclR family transcriptional regulator [Bradyrhizobium sp. U87765 SZCCT0131]MBR1265347.1 IclR family transcriptional regulator [Bradyrhizobium sp. U87765 SZCCT0134]MBR1302874.1 IclR family transcriptional regulator [Bradyrhizobium sp. U87765 SZCCT0110]MBR1323572.1 IclR family transcriptional regulator [Bradyrhizobium sp. U87765 SZCCT0109]MBR1346803.1 IclR family transcriptional regulator [Bradyrhizo